MQLNILKEGQGDKLLFTLGLKDKTIILTISEQIKGRFSGDELCTFLGVKEKFGYTGEQVKTCKMELPLSFTYVYREIIEHGFVGDVTARLLRTTPATNGETKSTIIHFENPHYHELMPNRFENILIEFTDDLGNDILVMDRISRKSTFST